MNRTLRLTRFLAPLILLAAFTHGATQARAALALTAQDKTIEQGTRQCLRDARRDYDRCRLRAHGNRGRLARCRRIHKERSSGCSG